MRGQESCLRVRRYLFESKKDLRGLSVKQKEILLRQDRISTEDVHASTIGALIRRGFYVPESTSEWFDASDEYKKNGVKVYRISTTGLSERRRIKDSKLSERIQPYPNKVPKLGVKLNRLKTMWVLTLNDDGSVMRSEEYWGKRTETGIKRRFNEAAKRGEKIRIVQFVKFSGQSRTVVDVVTGKENSYPANNW